MEMDEGLAAWREVEREELERGGRPAAPPPTAFWKLSPESARMDADFRELSKAIFNGDYNYDLRCQTETWSPPPRRGREMLTDEQMRLIGEIRALLAKKKANKPKKAKKAGKRTRKAERLCAELLQMDMRGEGADYMIVSELIFKDEE